MPAIIWSMLSYNLIQFLFKIRIFIFIYLAKKKRHKKKINKYNKYNIIYRIKKRKKRKEKNHDAVFSVLFTFNVSQLNVSRYLIVYYTLIISGQQNVSRKAVLI